MCSESGCYQKVLDENSIWRVERIGDQPETFLPFIDDPDFDLHNAYLYSAAKSVQDASNDYIVNFVNKYRQNFSRDILVTLLKHYTYVDLTTFYENEAIFNENLELVSSTILAWQVEEPSTFGGQNVPWVTSITQVGNPGLSIVGEVMDLNDVG